MSTKHPRFKSLPCNVLIFFVVTWLSCKKNQEVHPTPAPAKGLISFTLFKDSITAIQDTSVMKGDSLLITVPATTNIYNLSTSIKLGAGASVSPASGVYQDFSKPVSYTVTLSDNSSKTYIIKVITGKLKNVVYFGTSNGVFYALDAQTGTNYWTQSPGGNFSYASPVLANGIIYAGNTNGKMYAYTPTLGKQLWSFQAGSSIESSPAVSGGKVYFGCDDHYFYAVDAQTGALAWKFLTGSNVGSSPLVYNGTVYFGCDDHNFYALDATSGNSKWQYNTLSQFNLSSPAQLNGIVYIGDRSGNFYALDASTGQLKWSFSSGGISFEEARPVIVNGVIYVTSWYNFNNFQIAGSFYALDATTGALVWTALPNTGFSTGAAADGGELFVSGDNGNVYALEQNSGVVIWQHNQIYPNGAIPAAKNGAVFVGGGGTAYFYALDEKNGTLIWQYKTAALQTSKPCVIDANGN